VAQRQGARPRADRRRATAAKNYLVSRGVQSSRIDLISDAEDRPLCTERAEACWARNRRAHFIVKPE
jgi:peptidoglycan-associated lipoprotein